MIEIIIAIFYWVLESFVHVYIFHEGTLIHQLLCPNLHEIWMRSLTILFIFISNLICVRYLNRIAKWFKRKLGFEISFISLVCLISLFFGFFYWILESYMHIYVFNLKGNFMQQFFLTDVHEIWMRVLAIIFIFTFNFVAALFNRYSEIAEKKN